MAKRGTSELESVDPESELPQAKRARLEHGTPRRSQSQGKRRLQFRVVSPRNISIRQVKNSPMRRAIKRGMLVMKLSGATPTRKRRSARTLLKAPTPIKLVPEG